MDSVMRGFEFWFIYINDTLVARENDYPTHLTEVFNQLMEREKPKDVSK